MSTTVCVVSDAPGGPWRIRSERGNALLFGGVAFARRKEALLFLESANKKVGSRKWSVGKAKVTDDRQLSLLDLLWPGR